MTFVNGFVALIGRILLSLIFILSGIGKLADLAGTGGYMASVGLPASLALPAGLFELIAGLFILFGFFTRITAFLLAGFCLMTALLFHNDFADPMQQASFLKNIALAGGFLVLLAYNGVSHSFDSLRARRRTVVVERDPAVVREPVVVRETATRSIPPV
ncbi:DoxX family protein [Sphingobium boeckii]|uniref:Putative oxidoreductase n=1 Tax=Sphingobium boeckii TaxID=1082345 RepID=A0A7W9AGB0_9SPHN|nr:DoxX family protein [Sphingobium boeckii]MBB5685080.1 putative oxidoreductase [Sphingobium boeckii]